MKAFQRVVVGLDMDQGVAEAILARACQLASPDDIEAVYACSHLHREHHDYSLGSFDNSEALDAAVRRQADQYLARVCQPRGIRYRVLDGAVASVLHDYAREHADLVVVGSHGYQGLRALFASTSNAMIHGTPCDVLAVHIDDEGTAVKRATRGEHGNGKYEKVLAAVDLGDESFQVMDTANRVALHCGARLAVCNVTHTSYDPVVNNAAERLSHLADSYGISDDDFYELAGNVADRIHGLARDIGAGLVVVGTHGKHGLQLLTGSTANAVLHGASCDVLAVRMH